MNMVPMALAVTMIIVPVVGLKQLSWRMVREPENSLDNNCKIGRAQENTIKTYTRPANMGLGLLQIIQSQKNLLMFETWTLGKRGLLRMVHALITYSSKLYQYKSSFYPGPYLSILRTWKISVFSTIVTEN